MMEWMYSKTPTPLAKSTVNEALVCNVPDTQQTQLQFVTDRGRPV